MQADWFGFEDGPEVRQCGCQGQHEAEVGPAVEHTSPTSLLSLLPINPAVEFSVGTATRPGRQQLAVGSYLCGFTLSGQNSPPGALVRLACSSGPLSEPTRCFCPFHMPSVFLVHIRSRRSNIATTAGNGPDSRGQGMLLTCSPALHVSLHTRNGVGSDAFRHHLRLQSGLFWLWCWCHETRDGPRPYQSGAPETARSRSHRNSHVGGGHTADCVAAVPVACHAIAAYLQATRIPCSGCKTRIV